ncbi:MAG: hypothetical protein AAGF97_14355, partial [Planctomycetota bacterium]
MKDAWNQIWAWWGTDSTTDYAARLNELDQQLWNLVQTRAAELSRQQLAGYLWARSRGTFVAESDPWAGRRVADLTQRFTDRLAAAQPAVLRH